MPLRHNPSARQQRLGVELRRLREAAGLSAREGAALLGVSSAQLSQIELAQSGVSEQRVRRLAANYRCTDTELVDSLALMATSRSRGWWEEYREVLPNPFLDLAELDHHASHRWDVEFLHVPGLLQTSDYARALFTYSNPESSQSERELRVEHRMKRHIILERRVPVPYEAVIHEAALRIRVSNRAVHQAQLTRILELSEADHVTVRVIPFDLDDFGGAGSTMLYAGGPVPQLDTVVRDGPHGTALIDAQAQLIHYRNLFHRLKAASLTPENSREFIHRLTKEQ